MKFAIVPVVRSFNEIYINAFCFTVYDVVTGKIVAKLKGHVSFSIYLSYSTQMHTVFSGGSRRKSDRGSTLQFLGVVGVVGVVSMKVGFMR